MNLIIKKICKLYEGGLFHIVIGGTLSKLVAFISSIVVVRLVSKESYAALAYADNIYSYITLVAGLGMASSVLKFSLGDNKDKNYSFYRLSFLGGTIFQVCLILLVCIVIWFINIPFVGTKVLLYLSIPYGVLYYWSLLLQSFFRTEFCNEIYAKYCFMQVLLTFIFNIIGIKIVGIYCVPIARAFGIMVVCILYGKPFVVKIWKVSTRYLDKIEIKSFFIMGLSLLISNVFSMIMPLNETFLVNNLISDEIITANYKVANLIPSQLSFVTSSIVIYYFPILAQERNKIIVWEKSKKIGKYILFLIGFISMIGIIVTPIIITYIYGNQYNDAKNISILLWIVNCLNAGFRMLPMNILPALGCVKYNVAVSALSSIVHLILDYIFIVKLGIYGVVYATGIVYLISGVLYWYYLAKKTK